jgi:predicted  nucleic acid-binding Zn-ribbon protein
MRLREALRELSIRDTELALEADHLHTLDASVSEIRARSEEIAAFFAHYEETKTRAEDALQEAVATLERFRSEVAEAEADLNAAGSDDERGRRRHRLDRAQDHIEVAEHAIGERQRERDALDREAETFMAELPALEERAHQLTLELSDRVPLPAAGALSEWASHAHAALFVATGQIELQRERVIREANELATSLLGEPTYGLTPAQALARVDG